MPKVYVTNYNGNYDYGIVESHGELVYMTEGFLPDNRYAAVEKTFENYAKTATEDDYLFLSGSNITCAIAVTAWLRHRGAVTVLQHGKMKSDGPIRQLVPTCLSYHVSISQHSPPQVT